MATPLARTTASGIIGYIAWYGHSMCLPVAALLFPIWHRTQSRRESYTAVSLYYLGAVHQLPLGAYTFFDSALVSVAIWIGIGLLMPIPYTVLWSSKNRWLLPRLVAILLVISVPPFGILGMANPVTGAGILFPGLGWTGLIAFVALLSLLTIEPIKASGVMVVGVLLAATGVTNASNSWQGISTELNDLRPAQPVELYQRQRNLISLVSHSSELMIVLPESIAGQWHEGTSALWKQNVDKRKKCLLERIGMVITAEKTGWCSFPQMVPNLCISSVNLYRFRCGIRLTATLTRHLGSAMQLSIYKLKNWVS